MRQTTLKPPPRLKNRILPCIYPAHNPFPLLKSNRNSDLHSITSFFISLSPKCYSWIGKISWRRKWQPTPVILLGNPMDRGAWWAVIHGVAKSQTWLKWLSSQSKQTCQDPHDKEDLCSLSMYVLAIVLLAKSCVLKCFVLEKLTFSKSYIY